jgi:3'-phosphoadenosine 5'-phosphosulfate (PAPS) 3'-phosphatase
MQTSHRPSPEDAPHYLATAIRAAEAAGTVLLEHARSGFRIDYKAAINLVTDADRGAEESCIVRTILSAHPSHRILAEERGTRTGPRTPHIDGLSILWTAPPTSPMDFRFTPSRSAWNVTGNVSWVSCWTRFAGSYSPLFWGRART